MEMDNNKKDRGRRACPPKRQRAGGGIGNTEIGRRGETGIERHGEPEAEGNVDREKQGWGEGVRAYKNILGK